jgi:SH3-like domain-containing protein
MRIRIARIRFSVAAACFAIVFLSAAPQLRAQSASNQGASNGGNACAGVAKPAGSERLGASTCLPVPRFVSLRADAVNLRVGPGDQYPIAWVYHRVGLPVEVLREFDVWRLVVDADGTEGWMHEATLIDTRHFIIRGQSQVTLFRSPSDQSNPAAQLMPGVIGLIQRCDAGAAWCRVRVGHVGGWLQRAAFWGAFPGEAIPAK